jgi:hypothetical protein
LTVRQHSFYLDDDDWVALRHHCLDQGISVSAFIAQAARDATAGRTLSVDAAPPYKSVEIAEISLVPDTQANRDAGAGHIITTPEEAAAVAPYNPVRAVPKPAAKSKAKVRVRA